MIASVIAVNWMPRKERLIGYFELNKYFNKASNEEIKFVNNIAYNKANGEDMEAKNLVSGQLANIELEMYAAALYNLVTNYNNSLDLTTVDESVFIELVLNSFMKAVFPINHKLQRSGHFTSLEDEANLSPDTKLYTTIDGIRFDCLLIEVKCPNSACGDDLFKLSIEMQFILNRLIEHGTNSPVVYGVLIYDDIGCTKSICYDKDQNLVCEKVQSIAANKKKLSDNLGWVCKPITGIKQ